MALLVSIVTVPAALGYFGGGGSTLEDEAGQ